MACPTIICDQITTLNSDPEVTGAQKNDCSIHLANQGRTTVKLRRSKDWTCFNTHISEGHVSADSWGSDRCQFQMPGFLSH